MDYSWAYDNARNRFNNACSSICCCKNNICSLENEKTQTTNLINELGKELADHEEALKEINDAMIEEEYVYSTMSEVERTTEEATDNYCGMAVHSDTDSKKLNVVFEDEMNQTKKDISTIFSILYENKTVIELKISDLEIALKNAQIALENIISSINRNRSDIGTYEGIKRSASLDMAFYSLMMCMAG